MKTYRTGEIASLTGLHPNTIRFYEDIGFIAKPARLPNGYRVFTRLDLEQVRFCRLALRAEALQNGLRDTAVAIIRLSAASDFSRTRQRTREYIAQIDREIAFAEGAIQSVETTLARRAIAERSARKRREAAETLGITVETLRNWERNGLINDGQLHNGCRIYSAEDMKRLLIIRTLRCANYSISAILRLMSRLSESRDVNVLMALDTPEETDEIVSACDHLLSSLHSARDDAKTMLERIRLMEKIKTLH